RLRAPTRWTFGSHDLRHFVRASEPGGTQGNRECPRRSRRSEAPHAESRVRRDPGEELDRTGAGIWVVRDRPRGPGSLREARREVQWHEWHRAMALHRPSSSRCRASLLARIEPGRLPPLSGGPDDPGDRLLGPAWTRTALDLLTRERPLCPLLRLA